MRVVAVAAALAVAQVGTARAGERSSDAADSELKAREAFAAGRYDDAIETYAKLYARDLNPTYIRNIGRCYQRKHEPQKAIDEFRDYLAKTRSGRFKITSDERDEIEGYIKDMQLLRDEQARTAAASPAAPVAPVAPAPTPPTSAPVVTLTAPPPPPPEESHPLYKAWWFWTIVGAVAVGTATTIVLTTGGTSKPTCSATLGCQ
jgi:tetratricopeptide (TPR) repeat protein